MEIIASTVNLSKKWKSTLLEVKFKHKYKGLEEYPHLPLWNVEFEAKRELLRTYNINTVEDMFENVNGLFKDFMQRIRLLKHHKSDRNNDRIHTADIWLNISDNYKVISDKLTPIDRNKFKVYRKDKEWLKNRLKDYLQENLDIDQEVYEDILSLSKKLEG